MSGNAALTVAKNIILPEVLKALRQDGVPVHETDIPFVANRITAQIAPIAVSEANAEPWYQSRVTWGALVSIGTGMAALFGIAVSPADAELIVSVGLAVGTLFGGTITLWGRWAAKKPLGN